MASSRKGKGNTRKGAKKGSPVKQSLKHSTPNNLFPHDRHFVSRENVAQRIYDSLHKSQAVCITQTISGLGGVGKTLTAYEYAHRYMNRYSTVWRLTAETEETVVFDALCFMEYMELTGYQEQKSIEEGFSTLAVAFQAWFDNHKNWLLIFDNVEDMDVIVPYIPQKHSGHIIFTSRSILDSISETIFLDVFNLEEEAVPFLLKRTKSKDIHNAKAIAERLGCLPLALELAAACIVANSSRSKQRCYCHFIQYLSS